MRQFLLLLLLCTSITITSAQTATVSLPSDATEPYLFCFNEEISVQVNLADVNVLFNSGWYTSSEYPDFAGWSNSELWESTQITETEYHFNLNTDLYIWYQTNVAGGMLGSTPLYSNVLHLQLNGSTPQIIYSDTTFCQSSAYTLSAEPADLGDNQYQWYLNDEPITNATSANLDITVEGSYKVAAVTSPASCPNVYYPSQSVSMHYIKPELSARFKSDLNRVTLTTTANFDTYQWQQASSDQSTLSDITNATNASYNAQISATGTYYAVEASINGCTSTSNRILVNNTVYATPQITEPTNDFICADGSVELHLTQDSYSSYQWYKNGSEIYNQTSSTLIVTSDYSLGSGTYSVRVNVPYDETPLESNGISLTFAQAASIQIKDDATLCANSNVILQAVNDERNYDSYQWYFNDVNDFNSAVEISNATQSELEIAVPSEARYYWVSTTENGCSTLSNTKLIEKFQLYTPYFTMEPWDGKICMDGSATLTAYAENVNYQWYLDDKAITNATEATYVANEPGNYNVEVSSQLCANAAPAMAEYDAKISYRVTPILSVSPEGKEFNGSPIFCMYDEVTISIDNADNYTNIKWFGKTFEPGSTLDQWTELTNVTGSSYTFTNGVDNSHIYFKARVDSVMESGEICTGYSDVMLIDQWVFSSVEIMSHDNNSELCSPGDSTLLNLAYFGEYDHYRWTCNGVEVENSNNDSIYAKTMGDWVLTCYPEQCPSLPISSGTGPYVHFIYQHEFIEEDGILYSMPKDQPMGLNWGFTGTYQYQWYYNDEAMDMSTFDSQWGLDLEGLKPGAYTLKVTNPNGCESISDPYIVKSTDISNVQDHLALYPNPTSGEFIIELNSANNVESIEVFNMVGMLVKHINNISSRNTISISEEQNGLYMVKINFTNQKFTITKIVKQ